MNSAQRAFYSAAQVRELDRQAIDVAGIPGYSLMQRAAAFAFDVLRERWPHARHLVALCGPGNNGGDAYEVARLALEAGYRVEVLAVGRRPESGDAVTARKAWLEMSGAEETADLAILDQADVVVDGLLGTGTSRAPSGDFAAAIDALDRAQKGGTGVLALDIPSGLDADRGVPLEPCVGADATATFVGRKIGLFTGQGPAYAGPVSFSALGIEPVTYDAVGCTADSLDAAFIDECLSPRRRDAHKGHFGHVLIVGGNQGMAGAALLAARAALRSGAGLVSVATRRAHAAALTAAQPEMMVHGVAEPDELRGLIDRSDVVVVGPGLGADDWARAMLGAVLDSSGPRVLDADALNALASEAHRRDDWILTPHPGEAGRLLSCGTAEVQADRVASARALQSRYGGVTVLKGAGTLVAGDALGLCPLGNPGMAVGGMGDALSGVIGAMVAAGNAPEAAARIGVAVHSAAGDRAATRGGERGLLPSDLIDALRDIVNPT